MIVQVCKPTADSDDEEIAKIYEKIEKLIKPEINLIKSNEYLIVVRDAVEGEVESYSVIVSY